MYENTDSGSKASAEDKEEIVTLENFIHQDGSLYSFREKRHHELFSHLLKKRLYNPLWLDKAEKTHFLVILQAIRLLTRDKTILREHNIEEFSENIFNILAINISKRSTSQSNDEDSSQNIIVELISISRRLISSGYLAERDLEFTLNKIYEQDIFVKILDLIETTHHILLRCALEFLVILYDTSAELDESFKNLFIQQFEDIHYLSQLLIIIESYQSEFKSLAVNLLSKIVESDKVVGLTRKCFGFTIILNVLNSASEYNTRIAILHLIKVLVQNEDNIAELRALGLINLLLLMLRKSRNLFERILILTSLHLASHEPEASIKLHDLGINTLLRELLDVHPMRRSDDAFEDIADGDTDDLIKNYSLYLFRAIRSVFALERNRKVIKQVFPPRLFALFVDVGNYVSELENYAPVYKEFVNMPNKEFEILEKAIMDISNIIIANDNTNKFRKIRAYNLIQQIGKGAFGTVYLGRKGDHEYFSDR